MKLELFVTDVTAARSPGGEEHAILGVIFLPIHAVLVISELLCDVGTLLLNPYNFTQGHFMKLEWLVTDKYDICRIP